MKCRSLPFSRKSQQLVNASIAFLPLELTTRVCCFCSFDSGAGARVLQKEEDYYELTQAYLIRAKQHGVIHAELFVDPKLTSPKESHSPPSSKASGEHSRSTRRMPPASSLHAFSVSAGNADP